MATSNIVVQLTGLYTVRRFSGLVVMVRAGGQSPQMWGYLKVRAGVRLCGWRYGLVAVLPAVAHNMIKRRGRRWDAHCRRHGSLLSGPRAYF